MTIKIKIKLVKWSEGQLNVLKGLFFIFLSKKLIDI